MRLTPALVPVQLFFPISIDYIWINGERRRAVKKVNVAGFCYVGKQGLISISLFCFLECKEG